MIKKILFKNVVFNNFNEKDFKSIIIKKGVFVFPSAPGVASISADKKYSNSLRHADLVFFDSGLFVLLLSLFKDLKLKRFSGYKFLKFFFEFIKKNNKIKILSIDPNKKLSISNKKYFNSLGVNKIYNYLAPQYNSKNIRDTKLVKYINKIKPDYILTNISGGTQEILGVYLKKRLKFKTTIICTGGAISFFTGDQAPINDFIDKFYLGWFLRLIYNPLMFSKKLLLGLKLIPLVISTKIHIKK